MDNSKKFVSIAGIIAATGGLFMTLLPAFFDRDIASSVFVRICNTIFYHGQLTFFDTRLWEFYHPDMAYPVSYLNLIFFTFILLGSILFLLRGFKESRLLAFSFSVIFLLNIIQTLYMLIVLLVYNNEIRIDSIWWWLLTLISSSAWIWVSYRAVRIINANNPPEVIPYESDEMITKSYILANRWQRFMNLLIDRIMILLVFSHYIFLISYLSDDPLGSINLDKSGNQWVAYTLISLFLLVYYPIYETIFSTTPGKCLTNTSLIKEDGSKAGFQTVLVRTLSRLVPFEALSFLFGDGWHDRWSKTWVVKRENKGIRSAWYLLLIPLAACFAWGGYLAMSGYQEHKVYVKNKAEYDARMENARETFNTPGESHYVELWSDRYEFSKYFLKVQGTGKETVLVSKLFFKYGDNVNNVSDARDKYSSTTIPYDTFSVPKALLYEMLDLPFTDAYDSESGVNLFNDGSQFRIRDVYDLSEPCIRVSELSGNIRLNEESTGQDNRTYYLYLSFDNYGTPAQIVSLTPKDKSQNWGSYLRDTEAYRRHPEKFQLMNEQYKLGSTYSLRWILRDINGKHYTYLIEGKDNDYTIKRLP